MKLHNFPAVVGLALVSFSSALALTVNIDFSRDETGPLGGNSSPLYSGVAPAPDIGTVWNDYSISLDGSGDTIPEPYQFNNLLDSTGEPTTIDLELTSGWYRAFNSTNTVNDLQREWIFASTPSVGVATLTGLESLGKYDLYLITAGVRETDFTIGGNTKTATAAYTANPGTSWVEGREYVKFASVTADADGELVINVTAGSTETSGEWAGLQIVSSIESPSVNFLYASSVTSSAPSFSDSYPPSNLINNDFTSPADPIDTRTTYLAAGNNYATANGTTGNFDLTFEFPGPALINGMHVWNYVYRSASNTGTSTQGVKDFTLTFYNGSGGTGSLIGSVHSGSLTEARFNAVNTAESVHFPSSYTGVRSVVMHVNSNHGGSFTGMNELAFNGIGSSVGITSFTSSDSFVQKPSTATLSWTIEGNISSLEISPDIGDVTGLTTDGIGSIPVSPLGDQTYTLTLNGTIEQSLNVIGLPTREKLHIYLLIGQSNMQGRGKPYNTVLDAPDPRVIKFGERSDASLVDFSTGGHRLINASWVAGSEIGMGVEFGKTLIAAETDPEVVICLINHAVGGTAIQWWEPGVTNPTYKNPVTNHYYKLYDEALERATAAAEFGVIKGVLWHQGEYNCNNKVTPTPSDPNGYAGNLQTLVDTLRRDLRNSGLPFVCAKLSKDYVYPVPTDQFIVEAALEDLPNHRTNTFCVDNNGLKGITTDPIHFDAASQRLLGQRYATAIRDLYSDPFLLFMGGYLTPAEMATPLLTDPNEDNDNDGSSNFSEYAFLTDPTDPGSSPVIENGTVTVPGEGKFLTISFRQRIDTEAPQYIVQVSPDLNGWVSNLDGSAVTDVVGDPVDNGDGTETVSVRDLTSISAAEPKRFLRLLLMGK